MSHKDKDHMSLTIPSADAFRVAQSELPKLAAQLSMVHCSDLNGSRYHHQAQITWHKGRFFCMWFEDLWREDLSGQKAGYATSKDGLRWGAPGILAPMAERGYEMSTRESSGLWNRGHDLLALCAISLRMGYACVHAPVAERSYHGFAGGRPPGLRRQATTQLFAVNRICKAPRIDVTVNPCYPETLQIRFTAKYP